MKKNLKRAMALSLAIMTTAAMPMSNVFAGVSEGSIASSFTIDSPTLVVTVPTAVKLHVNESFALNHTTAPTAGAATNYKNKSIYSDPVKISNATLSSDGKSGVPIVATMYATMKPKVGANVQVLYDEAKVDPNVGTDKKVALNLVGESALTKTAGVTASGTGDTFDLTGEGDGTSATPTNGAALASDGGGIVPVTNYGSMMQIAINGPAAGTGTGETTPIYGGFALYGSATTGATWEEGDLSVDLYYKVKSTNTAYKADDIVAIGKTAFIMAANGANYDVLDAIKNVQGLATAPTNGLAANDTVGAVSNATGIANDLYFSLQGIAIDPSLTVTGVGLSYQDANGKWTDFLLTPDTDYKAANIFCANKTNAGTNERLIYVDILKSAGCIKYMAQLAKDAGKTTQDTQLIITFSDGTVRTQELKFPAIVA